MKEGRKGIEKSRERWNGWRKKIGYSIIMKLDRENLEASETEEWEIFEIGAVFMCPYSI